MTLVLETMNKSFLEHVETLAKQNGVSAVYRDGVVSPRKSKRVRSRGKPVAGKTASDKKVSNEIYVGEDGKIHISKKQWEEMVNSSSSLHKLTGILHTDMTLDEIRMERLAKHL